MLPNFVLYQSIQCFFLTALSPLCNDPVSYDVCALLAGTSCLLVISVFPWPSGLTNEAAASDSPCGSCRNNRALGVLARDRIAPGSQSVARDEGRKGQAQIPSLGPGTSPCGRKHPSMPKVREVRTLAERWGIFSKLADTAGHAHPSADPLVIHDVCHS